MFAVCTLLLDDVSRFSALHSTKLRVMSYSSWCFMVIYKLLGIWLRRTGKVC